MYLWNTQNETQLFRHIYDRLVLTAG